MKSPLYHSKMQWIYGFAILLFTFSNFFAQDTIYVSKSGSDSSPYSSWATASGSFQNAISFAKTGDIILVNDGTYTLSNNIVVNKAITVKSVNGYSTTIIDGNHLYRCILIHNSSAIVEGFTITNGYNPSGFGGAVNITTGGTIRNCYISNSQARDGGGIAIDDNGLIDNCIITENSADNNSGSGYGGGVRLLNGGTVRNSVIYGNSSANYGGGVNIWNAGFIENCTITDNNAPNGAGIRLRGNAVVRNSIIFGNTGTNYQVDGAGYNFINNITNPTPAIGTNTLTVDPLWIDATNNNFRLSSTSPAINAGINQNWMTSSTDMDGNPRVFGALVDLGAFEFQVTEPPVLELPASMTKNISVTPVLSWSNTTGATDYTLELSEDPTFTQNVQVHPGINTNSFTIVNPLKYNQIYFWRVKSNLSNPVYSSTFIFVTVLESPVLNYPGVAFPTVGQTPTDYPTSLTFRWGHSSGAYMYKIQVTTLDDELFANPIVNTWAGYGDTSYTVSNLQNWKNYLWRVYADNPATGQSSNWSNAFVFMTKLSTSELLTPINNAESVSVNPILSWNSVPGAMFYNVEIYSDLTCTNLVVQYSINTVIPNSTSIEIPFILENSTTYYWRVKATHIVSASNYSAVSKFTTIRKVSPILSWPLNGVQLNINTVTFSWYLNQLGTGVKYDLMYSTDINFTSPSIISNLNTTTYQLNNLSAGTKYYWRVRTKIGNAISAYSSIESFITNGNPALLVPITSWPVGGNTVYTLKQNLLWYLNYFYSGLTYEVELRVGDVSALTGVATILNINKSSVEVNLVQGTQYSWQVRSKSGTSYSEWSTPATFVTIAIPSVIKPIASWPIGNPIVYTTAPTLYWYLGALGTGLKYEVELVEGLNTLFTNTPTIVNIPTLFVQVSPNLIHGKTYKWRVRSTDGTTPSEWSDVAIFTVEGTSVQTPVVPTPSWPIGNPLVYTNQTNLYWYLGTSSTGFTYEVELRSGSLTGVANILNIDELNTPTGLLIAGTTYTWAVRSKVGSIYSDWSAPQTFTTIPGNSVVSVPIPSWPIGNATVFSNSQNLFWYVNAPSIGMKYDLKYSTHSNMSNSTIVKNLTSANYTLNNLLPGTTYYWKVRSYDGSVYSNYSNVVSFVTSAGLFPVMPITGSPINSVQLTTNTPVLSWFIPTVGNVESYEVEYSTSPDMVSSVINDYSATNAVVSDLEPNIEYFWRVRSKDSEGNYSEYSDVASFITSSVTEIQDETTKPSEFVLSQNYPNPFNPNTTIKFSIKESGFYSLEVYNTLGQKVATLINEYINAGNFNVNFNASNLSSGVYLYKLSGNNVNIIKKMTLMK